MLNFNNIFFKTTWKILIDKEERFGWISILFPLAPRWLWWGNSYFDWTQWNSGSSIGSAGSYERSPQYAFNKTWDTNRHIIIVEKTREQGYPMKTCFLTHHRPYSIKCLVLVYSKARLWGKASKGNTVFWSLLQRGHRWTSGRLPVQRM